MRYLALPLLLLAACGAEGAADDDPRVSGGYTSEAHAPVPDPPPPPVFDAGTGADDQPGEEADPGTEEGGGKEAADRAISSARPEREYHRGPRGGCYTYSESGKKRYVDRDLCN